MGGNRRWLVAVVMLAGCRPPAPPPTGPPTVALDPPPFPAQTDTPVRLKPEPVDAAGLHNVFRLSPVLLSGSSPDGNEGFAALAQLGVKTVVSVDGATPDLAAARRHGLRYVHLPVGYDGVPAATAARLGRAARDLPGPVYVHCHHGKHRGPAAAACVLLALDPAVTPTDLESWLKTAGTDPRYTGLIAVARRPGLSATEMDAAPADFPESAAVPDLTRLMVDVDARWDRLKAAKAGGWASPTDAAGEALQLRELYREALRLPAAAQQGYEFLRLLREAETAAEGLEEAVRSGDAVQRVRGWQRSAALCGRCHATFRD